MFFTGASIVGNLKHLINVFHICIRTYAYFILIVINYRIIPEYIHYVKNGNTTYKAQPPLLAGRVNYQFNLKFSRSLSHILYNIDTLKSIYYHLCVCVLYNWYSIVLIVIHIYVPLLCWISSSRYTTMDNSFLFTILNNISVNSWISPNTDFEMIIEL